MFEKFLARQDGEENVYQKERQGIDQDDDFDDGREDVKYHGLISLVFDVCNEG